MSWDKSVQVFTLDKSLGRGLYWNQAPGVFFFSILWFQKFGDFFVSIFSKFFFFEFTIKRKKIPMFFSFA
jgi:hypothetical protein